MAYTQAQIDQAKNMAASGVLSARTAEGEMVTYRSMAELLRFIETAQTEVSPASVTQSLASFSKD